MTRNDIHVQYVIDHTKITLAKRLVSETLAGIKNSEKTTLQNQLNTWLLRLSKGIADNEPKP